MLCALHSYCGARPPWWLRLVFAGVLAAARMDAVAAQGSTATIEVRVDATGADPGRVAVKLQSETNPSQFWSAALSAGESVRFTLLPPGTYRLISGAMERQIDVASGDTRTVDLTHTASPTPEDQDMRVRAPRRTAYGT